MNRKSIVLALFFLVTSLGVWRLSLWSETAGVDAKPPLESLSPVERGALQMSPPVVTAPATLGMVPSLLGQRMEGLGEGSLQVACIDHLHYEPVADVGIQFWAEGQWLAEGRVDENGMLNLHPAPGYFDEVWIESPDGWWCVKHGLVDGVYLVRMAPSSQGPLRGKLIDRSNGEPVPEYTLELLDTDGWSETVTTDLKGQFQTESLMGRGTVKLIASEEEFGEGLIRETLATHDHSPDGAMPSPVTIAIHVGATYRIALENPGEVPLFNLRAYLQPVWLLEQSVERLRGGMAVHPGEYPWARVRWMVAEEDRPHLLITDRTGLWRGMAAVQSGSGHHTAPVAIRLERHLRVRGKVLNSEGEPVSGAMVELISDEASELAPIYLTRSSVMGIFIFEGVKQASYELSAWEAQTGRANRKVEVFPGLPTEHSLVLESYDVGGDISGVVRSHSQSFDKPLRMYLRSTKSDSACPTRQVPVVWEAKGGSVEGRFCFQDVARGHYTLAMMGASIYEVAPNSREVQAPESGVEFFLKDDAPRFRVKLFVRDMSSGEYLSQATWRVVSSDGEELANGLVSEARVERRFAKGDAFTWSLEAPGYEALSGDQADYEQLSRGSFFGATVYLKLE